MVESFHSQKPWWQVLPPVQVLVPVPVQGAHCDGVELVTADSNAHPQGSVLSVTHDRLPPSVVRLTFIAQSGIVPALPSRATGSMLASVLVPLMKSMKSAATCFVGFPVPSTGVIMCS